MHFRQLTLMVEKLEESIEFYQTIIELTISRRIKMENGGEVVFLTNGEGETEIELVCMPQMQKFEGKGLSICFETEDLDKKHEIIQSKGLNPSEIRTPDAKSRYFWVYDPNGISIQLRQKL
ncbi:lactoylglutathione lyase [Clostridium sp. USBA 49]|jgi:lactoylglutathione lyase|uniref:VOC family protein n=1 Tax=Clostridium TaxID=1485 RepID=UPI0009995E9F|nr:MULTISPECIES: VOC family protein [Clostridium]SKA85183.1 lactoylglutathione lyase [Clostridium sp. USBA 49]